MMTKSTAEGDEGDYLRELRRLAISAVAETDMVTTFTGKWRIIRCKLQSLPTELDYLSEHPGLLKNELCKEILDSFSTCLREAHMLVNKCILSDPDAGKLQMKSSLDSLVLTLTQHLEDFQLLKTSDGLVRPPLSSPSFIMTCTCKELLTRLQIGNLDSRQKALDSLVALMNDDDRNVLIVVGIGGIPVLIQMLDSSFTEIREKASVAVSIVAKSSSCEKMLVSEGCLPPLTRIIDSGTSVAKQRAASALQSLSRSPENAKCVGTHCNLSALVDICHFGTPASQASAVGILRNLASVNELRHKFVDENAVPVLIRLCNSGTTLAQEYAVECLQILASEDDELRMLIAKEDGIQPLLYFWDRAASPMAQQVALGALNHLCACRMLTNDLVSMGLIPRLVNAIKNGNPTMQHLAGCSITELASCSQDIRKLLGEGGCISGLVKMLEARTAWEQEASARALSVLLLCDYNRRLFRKEVKGIPRTVRLLDPFTLDVDKKYPVSILLSLSTHSKSKKQMTTAGACFYLEKLADSDVPGARKLLECLKRVQIWSMFVRHEV